MDVPTEIELDDRMVTGFVAVQTELMRFNLPTGVDPDPKMIAQLEGVARRSGFASFADFEDVSFTVTLVLGGIDPQTGTFSDPTMGLRKEIAELTADRSVPAAEKKLMLADMQDALTHIPKVLQFPGNVDVVMRHMSILEQLAQ